ncbi:MAG: transporter substrate-binding domain-containing protein [Pseudomonadales bacterium]|nr:transporter substrate-binding domain-containing protein [Pseudomonadales bacterium]
MCNFYLINTKLALTGILFACFISPAYSDKTKLKIEVLTEQYYPLNYTESGKDDDPIIGFSTELVKAVMNESGFNYDIKLVPWARAVRAIDTRENVIVYSMARSPDREDKYHWIGEIWPGTIVLYGLKEKFTPIPKSIDEIKHLRVGISINSVAGNYLQVNGFTQLYSVKSTNYLKLLQRGRIDLFPFIDFSMVLIADREGYDRDKIVAVLKMSEISMPLSIAASKQTKPEIVSRLRKAYKNTIDSGTYDKIMLPFKHQLATKVYNQ